MDEYEASEETLDRQWTKYYKDMTSRQLVPYVRRAKKTETDKLAASLGKLALGMVASTAGAKVGRYYGGKAGAYVGRRVGSRKTGKRVGKFVGAVGGAIGARRLVGSGAYQITSGDAGTNLIMDMAQETVRIKRTEYVGPVYSGTGTPSAFNTDIYRVNPGLDINNAGMFTWIPQIARAYESYKMHQCVVEFRSSSGNATGSDTSLGSVLIAGQYRNASEDFVNKAQMLNSSFATSASPDKNQFFAVECASKLNPVKWHDVRDGELPANSDIDLSDLVKITVASQGCPTASQELGNLYIHYDIELTKATVDPSDSNIQGAVAYIAGAADVITEASPFSSSVNNVEKVSGNTFNLELITSSANTGRVRFPKHFGPIGSLWCIMIAVKGSSTAGLAAPSMGTHNGFTLYSTIYAANQADGGGSATALSNLTNSTLTSSTLFHIRYFKFNGVDDGSQPYVEYNHAAATFPDSATDVWVGVSRVNSAAFDNPLV